MSIKVTKLPDAEPRPRHVAIGTFDGVHVGHQATIDAADTVLTFDPHPLEILHPPAAPKLIMPFKVKRDVIEGRGVDELVVIPFDEDFTKIPAKGFIEDVLIEKLGAERVSVGENFRFGAKALGDPAMLQSCDEFETRVVPLVEVDGETVSSSRIRALVAAGEVEEAQRCLGAPFMLEGPVVEGDKRGRELGFPTANLVPDDRLVTRGHGVYAAFANGFPAAVNIGVRPTFESGRGVLIEAYLIDHEEDLYGQNLRIAFVERLRGEKRFPSVEDLIAQMHRDVEDARRACASFQPSEARGPLSFCRNAADQGTEGRADRQVRPLTRRHRLGRGPDRPADGAHQRAHRAPARPQQGPPLASRPADAGRQAPPPAPLPGEQRPGALPGAGRRAGYSPVIEAGETAPDFTLPNHKGEMVSLSDFRGRKVMLVFYPADFSPVCSDQLSIYQEVLGQIDDAGVQLLGISVDSSWTHNAFRKKLGIDIPLLADFHPKGKVSSEYGAYIEDFGTGNRSLVLIDEEGVVRWVHESPSVVDIPGANLIFDALEEVSAA